MNAKHTPGPWTVSGSPGATMFVDGPDGHPVFRIRGGMLPVEANARLIAAAPDLLAALTDLVELHHDWEPGGRALKSLVVSNDKFIAAARAAIARATMRGTPEGRDAASAASAGGGAK